MTKSTPSTSTSIQQNLNPLGEMQGRYLTPLWDQASYMAGRIPGTDSGGGPVAGQTYLDQMQNISQNNATASGWMGSQLVPNAGNFTSAALTGNAGSYLPAASQIRSLNGMAQGAAAVGQGFADNLTGTAFAAPGTVAPWASGLAGLAGQYGGLTNAGYGSYGALNQFGNQAAGAGQQTAASLYGLAPQGMAAGYPSEQQLMANSGMAISGNPAFSSGLRGLASGAYIDPSTNPALQGTIQAATDPITRQFMTSTAPLTDSNFSGGGRYGSGAWTNAQGQNQFALGGALANATSNIVNNAYNTGLSTTLGAGQAIGNLYNQGVANSNQAAANAGQLGQAGVGLTGNLIQGGGAALTQGYGTAGNLYGAGAGALNSLGGTGLGGASSNYSTGGQLSLSGLNSMMQGLGAGATAANQGYGTGISGYAQGGNLANAGVLNLGGLAQMTPDLSNYPLSQLSTAYNTGWAPLQNYGALLGAPMGGNTTTSGSSTTPYTQNWGMNLLNAGLGIAGIAAKI